MLRPRKVEKDKLPFLKSILSVWTINNNSISIILNQKNALLGQLWAVSQKGMYTVAQTVLCHWLKPVQVASLAGRSCTCQHAFIYSALPTDQDGITRQKGFALFQNHHISRNKMVWFQFLETCKRQAIQTLCFIYFSVARGKKYKELLAEQNSL